MAITTGKVRASYVSIFQPREPKGGGEAKYSVTLLIPKSDTVTINNIYSEIEKAKQAGLQEKFGGVLPPMLKTPLHDGDGVRQSGEPYGEECKGHMVITASAKQRPSIVGLDMQNIINPAEVYSGCYIRANINLFAFHTNGNKGIGCGLNAIQKVEDGEPLTGIVSAEEAFGGCNTYVGAGGQFPQPQAPAPYGQAGQMPFQAAVSGYQSMPTAYGQPAAVMYQQQAVPQIDPITGRPMLAGGILGLS